MGTDITVIRGWVNCQSYKYRLVLCLLLINDVTVAADWKLTPSLTVSEIYSDNIGLAPSDEQSSDFVTLIQPGLSANLDGNRLDVNLNYDMQNIFYARNSGSNATNHQLDLGTTAELFKDRLFLDIDGAIKQQIIDANESFDSDNISTTDNNTDVITFGISPYFRSDFNGYAETEIRYSYDVVHFSGNSGNSGNGSGTQQRSNSASDSQQQRLDVNLTDGRRAGKITWSVDYSKSRLKRDDSGDSNGSNTETGDSERENLDARINYQLSEEWQVSARAGYENNDLASRRDGNSQDNENGGFWSVGGIWTPNRFLELDALYGPSENEIKVTWTPTSRTSVIVSRRDRDVGVDSGVIYQGSLAHRTKYTRWSAEYVEETTSTQELVVTDNRADDEEFSDENGQVALPDEVFDLTDEEFFRKRFNLGFAYMRGRSQISVNSFVEDREFNDPSEDERSTGANVSWEWQFGAKTGSVMDLRWVRNESSGNATLNNGSQIDDSGDDTLVSLSIGLAHTLSQRLNAGATYSFTKRDSNVSEQDYRENRVTLQLRMEF